MAVPKHVWVDVTGQWGVDAEPGVLLDWRKSQRGGWQAWVISVRTYSTGHGQEPIVKQSWHDAAHVKPAQAKPPGSEGHC